jgi:prepilin-type N-terminal cleavage/methylation domain-containing protein
MMPRRGFTLIELIVVIAAVAVIMSAAGVLMHFVLQMDTEVHLRTRTVTTVGRLAEQFRRDVHQARGEPVIAANHRAVELHLPGGKTVKWRTDEAGGLVRTEQARGGAGVPPADRSAGVPPANREDSFTLPKGTTAALELQPQGARIVTIRIESPGTGGPSLVIEALASRDERLAAEEEKP